VVLVRTEVSEDSLILVNLMMEALGASETSVLTRATRRNIPEDGEAAKQERRIVVEIAELKGFIFYCVSFSPQAKYTDFRPPLVGEF
jgi:hypothetical protein